MNHIMLDLETMDNGPLSAIVQIGAVQFNPYDGSIGKTFETNVDLTSAVLAGATVNQDTMDWWRKQGVEAQKALCNPAPVNIHKALTTFSMFIDRCACKYGPFVWGNGATFDNVILTSAYQMCGMKRPWTYRNDRDVRTLVALGQMIGYDALKENKRTGTYHRGVDDAKYQAQYVSKIWQKLYAKKEDPVTINLTGDKE